MFAILTKPNSDFVNKICFFAFFSLSFSVLIFRVGLVFVKKNDPLFLIIEKTLSLGPLQQLKKSVFSFLLLAFPQFAICGNDEGSNKRKRSESPGKDDEKSEKETSSDGSGNNSDHHEQQSDSVLSKLNALLPSGSVKAEAVKGGVTLAEGYNGRRADGIHRAAETNRKASEGSDKNVIAVRKNSTDPKEIEAAVDQAAVDRESHLRRSKIQEDYSQERLLPRAEDLPQPSEESIRFTVGLDATVSGKTDSEEL